MIRFPSMALIAVGLLSGACNGPGNGPVSGSGNGPGNGPGHGSGDGADLRITHEFALALSSELSCSRPNHLKISNDGDQSAYAVVLNGATANGQPIRIHPGPAAGEAVLVVVCRPPELTGRWCIEARLQQLSEFDPPDPNPADNLWCAPAGQ